MSISKAGAGSALRASATQPDPVSGATLAPTQADSNDDNLSFTQIAVPRGLPLFALGAATTPFDAALQGLEVTLHDGRDYLLHMPTEVTGQVIIFLTPEDHAHLAGAAKGLRNTVQGDELAHLRHPEHNALLTVRGTGTPVETAQAMRKLFAAMVERRRVEGLTRDWGAQIQDPIAAVYPDMTEDANSLEYFDAHVDAARIYRELGQSATAADLISNCIEKAPSVAYLREELASHHIASSNFPDAVEQARLAFQLAPHSLRAAHLLGGALVLLNTPESRAELVDHLQHVTSSATRSMALQQLGAADLAYRMLGRALGTSTEFCEADELAFLWASRIGIETRDSQGEVMDPADHAFEQLERVFASPRQFGLQGIVSSPFLSPLHQDQRWDTFVERVGRRAKDLADIEFAFDSNPDAVFDMPEIEELLDARQNVENEFAFANHGVYQQDQHAPPEAHDRLQAAWGAVENAMNVRRAAMGISPSDAG